MLGGGPQALRNASAGFHQEADLYAPARNESALRSQLHRASGTHQTGHPSAFQGPQDVVEEVVLLQQDVAFLRDYVKKCEDQLRFYQIRMPQLDPGAAPVTIGDDHDQPPWSHNSKYMAPLLVAYEQRLEELEKGTADKTRELDTLKTEVEGLVNRNQGLETELENSYHKLIKALERKDGGMGGKENRPNRLPGSVSEMELEELRERCELYKEERDVILAQDKLLQETKTKLEKSLSESEMERKLLMEKLKNTSEMMVRDSKRCGALEAELGTLRVQLSEVVSRQAEERRRGEEAAKQSVTTLLDRESKNVTQALERELESLRSQLASKEQQAIAFSLERANLTRQAEQAGRNAKKKLQTQQTMEQQHLAQLNTLKQQIVGLQGDLQVVQERETQGKDRIRELERLMGELTDRERSLFQQQEMSQRDMQGMVASIESMERAISVYKARELALVKRESVLTDQAEAAKVEVARMKQTIEQLTQQNHQIRDSVKEDERELRRTSAEALDISKRTAKDRETKLSDETRRLQLCCVELESLKQRAERDTASVQFKLDTLTASSQKEIARLAGLLSKAQRELSEAQTETRFTECRTKQGVSDLERKQKQWDRERELLLQEIESVRVRGTDANAAKEMVEEERNELIVELKGVNEKLADALSENDRLGGEVRELEEQSSGRDRTLQTRLREALDMQEDVETRAQEMLLTHEELVARLRNENKENILHFQRLLREQKVHSEQLSHNLSELTASDATLLREREQAVVLVTKLERTKAEQQLKLGLCESRLATVASKLNAVEEREAKLLEDTKLLRRKLEQSVLQNRRLERQAENAARRADYSSVFAASGKSHVDGDVSQSLAESSGSAIALDAVLNSAPPAPLSDDLFTIPGALSVPCK